MSTSSFLSTFSPDRFSGLQTLLSGLFTTGEVSQDHLKEVYAQLDQARPWFLNLLNIPQPSKQERDQVENGQSRCPVYLWSRQAGGPGEVEKEGEVTERCPSFLLAQPSSPTACLDAFPASFEVMYPS
jgi:hypothetical protein